MNHKDFIETDLRIINLLAKEREYCQFNMPDQLNSSYRTVMRRLTELENMGFKARIDDVGNVVGIAGNGKKEILLV